MTGTCMHTKFIRKNICIYDFFQSDKINEFLKIFNSRKNVNFDLIIRS